MFLLVFRRAPALRVDLSAISKYPSGDSHLNPEDLHLQDNRVSERHELQHN